MKVTMYELLGMVKDGKAPKKIKFNNDEWYWGYDTYIPYSFLDNTPDVQISVSLFQRYRIDYCLNKEIEILKEEKKIPEKLPYYDYSKIMSSNDKLKTIELMLEKHEKRLNDNWEKINEIIDYLDYLKNKGDE